MTDPYVPRRIAQSTFVDVRGLRYHVASWPGRGRPIILLHGFMDCGATFQFLVDALADDRPVLAPDWRGFGQTAWPADGYWFPDYLADLDALLDELAPGAPADVVGHSMGGNVALMYAGLRPDRVRRVVTLEGFGLPDAAADRAPAKYREWLDQLRQPEQASVYPGVAALAGVLRKRNPRLRADRAAFVAHAWAESLPDGRARLRFDPAHRRVNPVLYRRAEAEACWREVRAPVAYVAGAESEYLARLGSAAEADAMRCHLPRLEAYVVPGAGHMLHHDQPEAVGGIVEAFLVE